MTSSGMYIVEQYSSSRVIKKRLLKFTGSGNTSDAGKYSVVLNQNYQ